jgi:hypothetical protein
MTFASNHIAHPARRLILILTVACLALAASADTLMARDLFPPPWRGAPRSTYSHWEFLTPSSGFPDGLPAPVVGDGGGLPEMVPAGGIVWDPVFAGSWIGTTGGTMEFYIPNWIDNEPWKDIYVQITYQPNPQFPPPTLSNIVSFHPNGTGPVTFLGGSDILLDPLNNLYQRTEVWRLVPNPYWERFNINIFPDMVIDQVVIDTWSVPEPSSFALAGVGLALMGWRAWRRKRT